MKRAVAAIIRQGNQILLCRRSLSSRNQPGKWENPGGEIDPNETPGEAIVREMALARSSEREGRIIDHDAAASMEKKKQEGYF